MSFNIECTKYWIEIYQLKNISNIPNNLIYYITLYIYIYIYYTILSYIITYCMILYNML